MIYGIGTDIVDVRRVQKAMQKERFFTLLFTPSEIELFNQRNLSPQTVAGNFAAKEALVKALGQFNWQEIEVLRDESLKPFVALSGNAATNFKNLHLHVSISHEKHYATAVAVAELL